MSIAREADVQIVRKQTLLLLESGGYPRDHELFKELFSMVTKGTYFAFVSPVKPDLWTALTDV
jgi:hypothetical protein